MADYPAGFQQLIDSLRQLPGIGPRGAERLAFAIIKWPDTRLNELGDALKDLRNAVAPCPCCGNLSVPDAMCAVCADQRRNTSLVCVVEDAARIRGFEQGRMFNGLYHVLGGKLSPLNGVGADDLNIQALLARVDAGGIEEIILALSSDMEGRTTATYIAGLLKESGIKVTKLAQGLPAGADISHADPATISAAIAGRTSV